MTRHVMPAVVLAAVLGCAACGPTAPTDPTPTLERMTVDSPSFSRDNGVKQWSVYCIPADATDLKHAARWRQVEVVEQGPDGPDGYWAKGRACPAGPVLSQWPPAGGTTGGVGGQP